MKIKLIVVGKTHARYLIQAEEEYLQRLKHYIKFEKVIVPDLKNSKNLTPIEQNRREGELIISKIEKNEEVVLLDDKGVEFTSIKFAQFINQKMIQSTRCLTFIIGGAYGFSDEVYARANAKISLSKMTFSHQMVRMIFKEQLYRAFTIIKGEKYHHE